MTNINNTPNYSFTPVSAATLKESHKAWFLSVAYWTKAEDKKLKEAKIWVPKSCSKAENGVVVEIADFVLNNWVKEHNDYLRNFSRRLPEISFDLVKKEHIVGVMKKKANAEKERRANALEAIYNETLPVAEKNMKELTVWTSVYARWYRAFNKNLETCAKLEELSNRMAKVYGRDEKKVKEHITRMMQAHNEKGADYDKIVDNWIWGHANRETLIEGWHFDLYYHNAAERGFTTQDAHDFWFYYADNVSRAKSELGRKLKKHYKFFLEFITIINEMFKKN